MVKCGIETRELFNCRTLGHQRGTGCAIPIVLNGRNERETCLKKIYVCFSRLVVSGLAFAALPAVASAATGNFSREIFCYADLPVVGGGGKTAKTRVYITQNALGSFAVSVAGACSNHPLRPAFASQPQIYTSVCGPSLMVSMSEPPPVPQGFRSSLFARVTAKGEEVLGYIRHQMRCSQRSR